MGCEVRNEVIREKIVTEIILGRMENDVLKWYGHVIRMEDDRWSKRIVTWSPGGRKWRRRPELEKGIQSAF